MEKDQNKMLKIVHGPLCEQHIFYHYYQLSITHLSHRHINKFIYMSMIYPVNS